ncbi:glycosyltransferase [Micromonospora sp. DH14]|uniref:glycosyltransferase n=1 Tax=Micromonospora sp. DH14 TaxID=3040120 RepID=UPI0024432955|nr:glycosyltransferase [Micromonospora sp. DH14]MDG9672840.1 glycosyltransferase [Micromonospora sp. DH14]
MKLSVVIPTYNRSDILQLTLESLVRQDLDHDDYEVLVVDDGSSDDTADVVKKYMDQMNLRYFFQEDEGYRAAGARNVGISHAEGEITVFMDAGVMAHSSLLRVHLATHEAYSEPIALCGYVFGYSLNNENADEVLADLDVNDVDGTIEQWREKGLHPDIREDFFIREGDDFSAAPAPWLMYWTFNSSVRTEQLRRVGMFDDAFRAWGGEDVDLGYRLHRDGARMFLNRDAVSLHWPHARDGEGADAVANYQYMARKYDTPITRLLDIVPTINFFVINDVIRGRKLTH